jgi:NADH-quinone oxidoreductase subunit C
MADKPITPAEAAEESEVSDAIEETVEALERAMPDDSVLKNLLESYEDAVWELSAGQHTVTVPKDRLRDFAGAARGAGFEMLVDVTAVDHLRRRRVRFEVVIGLLSLEHHLRLRLLVPVDADDPSVPSLVPVYPAANFFEREVFDMFGIVFADHPDLTRILLPDDWVGHPLRKDFSTGAVPVQFKSSPQVT